MTIEEITAKVQERIPSAEMVQIRSEVDALVRDYNEAIQTGNYEAATKADTSMGEKVNDYTAAARDIYFDICKESDSPMLTAVTILSFTTLGIKDEKKGDDKVPVRTVVDKERAIDLQKLHKYCGGIGADENWSHIAQKMNFLLTAQKAVDLGLDPKAVNDSYAMSEIAREFNMGKNPTSKTNLLRTLQAVITAMLGDGYKATSHDVNFLLSVYSKKNRKALVVSCANHRNFRNYLAEICHRIVTGKSYELDYKTKKDA